MTLVKGQSWLNKCRVRDTDFDCAADHTSKERVRERERERERGEREEETGEPRTFKDKQGEWLRLFQCDDAHIVPTDNDNIGRTRLKEDRRWCETGCGLFDAGRQRSK
jgi:hypothetical protein